MSQAAAAEPAGPPGLITVFVKARIDDNTKLGDCPFSQRVLLTLEHKKLRKACVAGGLPYKAVYIDLANKPKWLEERGGKVPVIQQGDMWLADSDAITQWLEQQHPDPPMKTYAPPKLGSQLVPAFQGWLKAPASQEGRARESFLTELRALEEGLGQRGQSVLFGLDHMDATDAKLAPRVHIAVIALEQFKGWRLPGDEYPNVAAWLAAMRSLPEWPKTDGGREAIVASMQRKLAGS